MPRLVLRWADLKVHFQLFLGLNPARSEGGALATNEGGVMLGWGPKYLRTIIFIIFHHGKTIYAHINYHHSYIDQKHISLYA